MNKTATLLTTAVFLTLAPLCYSAQASDGMSSFEGFQASLRSELRVAIVNGDRKLDHELVAKEARGESVRFRDRLGIDTFQGWSPETKAAMAERKAQFAILIKRVKTKKGKTIAHNFGPAFYSSWGENVQYTGGLATAELEAYEHVGGKWKKAASWEVTYDRTGLPGGLDGSKVKDGKYTVDPKELVQSVVDSGISGGLRGAQHYGIAVPFGSSVEWVRRLEAPEQAEFWRRLSGASPLELPLNWRGLDKLAIELWRRCEAEGSKSGPLIQAIQKYCTMRRVRTTSAVAAEQGLREQWRAAESAKLIHWRKKRGASTPLIYLNEEAATQLNLSQSSMPRLISSRLMIFGKEDMQFFKAKKSPRKFIGLAHGVFVVEGYGYGDKLIKKLGKKSMDAAALDEAVAGAFPGRWPSGS